MATSDALDLDSGVFKRADPRAIARSLKRSAERSDRRKAEPFRSAMSMLVFYINRAGRSLPARQRTVLEKAKDELRVAFHRPPRGRSRRGPASAGATRSWSGTTRAARRTRRARAR
jgi:hypothetical protein